jgi:hypothetical protein
MLAYPTCSRGPDAAFASPAAKVKSKQYRRMNLAKRVLVPASKRRYILDF